jgi:hypothetical protein
VKPILGSQSLLDLVLNLDLGQIPKMRAFREDDLRPSPDMPEDLE